MAKVHLIADESIGGIQREYVEVDRNADVRDNVIHNFEEGGGIYFTDNQVYEVICEDGNGEITLIDDEGCEHILSYEYYKTLEPTDIVQINGERFKLVERNASIGEKVLIVSNTMLHGLPVGKVFKCAGDESVVYKGTLWYIANEDGTCADYKVLEPVAYQLADLLAKCTPETRHEEIATVSASDIRWQPDKVVDLLANLARRVTSLESQLKDTQGNVERQAQELANLAHLTESNEGDIRDLDERTQVINSINQYYGGAR